jgi:catechol 2,3-dioxygenase-like lactoylglutathione lyase family enzyme
MSPRLSLITLGTNDLDRAIRFYRDGLGFPMSSASQGDVAFFRTGGCVLALFPRDKLAVDAQVPDPLPAGGVYGGFTIAHNVADKADVAPLLAQAERAGAKILRPAQDAFWGGHHGYFADPDGHVWEVAWNPFFPLDAAGQVTLPV